MPRETTPSANSILAAFCEAKGIPYNGKAPRGAHQIAGALAELEKHQLLQPTDPTIETNPTERARLARELITLMQTHREPADELTPSPAESGELPLRKLEGAGGEGETAPQPPAVPTNHTSGQPLIPSPAEPRELPLRKLEGAGGEGQTSGPTTPTTPADNRKSPIENSSPNHPEPPTNNHPQPPTDPQTTLERPLNDPQRPPETASPEPETTLATEKECGCTTPCHPTPTCTATNRFGEPCRRNPKKQTHLCYIHNPLTARNAREAAARAGATPRIGPHDAARIPLNLEHRAALQATIEAILRLAVLGKIPPAR